MQLFWKWRRDNRNLKKEVCDQRMRDKLARRTFPELHNGIEIDEVGLRNHHEHGNRYLVLKYSDAVPPRTSRKGSGVCG